MEVKILLFTLVIILLEYYEIHGAKTIPLLMPNVQPIENETYLCTAYKMPKDDYEYIVAFRPNATMATAHHILIYGCELPGKWQRDTPRYVWGCGEMTRQSNRYEPGPTCYSGSQIIYAWALEAPPLQLPDGVGFRVGKDTGINYLVLQVHYANVNKFLNGATDDSGVFLTVLPSSDNRVTKSAGVLLLGTSGQIPAKETENMETACLIDENVELHPFAFRTHTHALGQVVSGYKIDRDGEWHLIGKHNPQEPQMFYPVENKNLVISYGDVVAARCTMYNFRNRKTYIGSTKNDEMCNFYMMYYVEGNKALARKQCFSDGPPLYYWKWDPQVIDLPPKIDRDASSLN